MSRDYGSATAFFDLLFNILCCFVVLFSISFLLMSKKIEDDRKIKATAEFMVTSIWPKGSDNDVDTYMEDPLGNLVFFQKREEGLMHLDRDDLGRRSDTVKGIDGSVFYVPENREIVTVRGIIPGEYVVNVHMYLNRDRSTETPVTVTLEKLNPQVTIVTSRKIDLGKTGDEKTAFRFTVGSDGNVTETGTLFKSLAVAPPPGEADFIYNQYGD